MSPPPDGAGRHESAGGKSMLPASILIGCAMIAGGLYLGLRARPSVRDEVPAPAHAAATASAAPDLPAAAAAPTRLDAPPSALATAPATPAQPAPVTDGVQPAKDADDDLRAALEARRAMLVTQCWAPAVRAKAQPDRSTYRFNALFDEAGKQVGLGISELDQSSRADVAHCLRGLHMTLSIPARGARADTTAKMTLP